MGTCFNYIDQNRLEDKRPVKLENPSLCAPLGTQGVRGLDSSPRFRNSAGAVSRKNISVLTLYFVLFLRRRGVCFCRKLAIPSCHTGGAGEHNIRSVSQRRPARLWLLHLLRGWHGRPRCAWVQGNSFQLDQLVSMCTEPKE